eukprot:m.104460 g.104460  ORF g.104460 m.104460 type:complete len:69 (-) comp12637_c3_seq8:2880-3086(-)
MVSGYCLILATINCSKRSSPPPVCTWNDVFLLYKTVTLLKKKWKRKEVQLQSYKSHIYNQTFTIPNTL